MIKTKPKIQNWTKKRRQKLEFWLTQSKAMFSLIWGGLSNPNLASVSKRAKIQMQKMKIKNAEDEDQCW